MPLRLMRTIHIRGRETRMPSRSKKTSRRSSTKKPAVRPKNALVQHVNRPGRPAEWPYSDGVWVGDTFYVSGHLGLDPATRLPPSSVEQEAQLVLSGVQTTLAAANLTMDNLVWVQIFCSDVELFTGFNNLYRTYFKNKFPARAFLGSGPLLFGCRFEVLGVAAKS
jgi:2-iminobutanoate/2-iminopropanoate deaminase